MSSSDKPAQNRDVQIGGKDEGNVVLSGGGNPNTGPAVNRGVKIDNDAIGNVIVTGDNNQADANIEVNYQPAPLAEPESVDIRQELAAIRDLLAELQSEDRRKIENAFEDAEEELRRDEPDKEEVGKAIDRALEYAQKAPAFGGMMDRLKPHVTGAASWLGSNWHKLLGVVGLMAQRG